MRAEKSRAARFGDLGAAATVANVVQHFDSTSPAAPLSPSTADAACVRDHRKRMSLWPSSYLLEELRVIDAAEAMADFDNAGYEPDVVRNSAVELASQRQAISEILDYRECRGIDVPPPAFGIPRETIDEMKARRPIEAEVELLTHLRRAGQSCRGTCPICPGRSNPSSLAVWPGRGTWRCFRCSVGGDVIQWLLATRTDWDFPQAARYLSGVTGVELPSKKNAGQAIADGRLGIEAIR